MDCSIGWTSTANLHPWSSVYCTRSYSSDHFEIPPNAKVLFYDAAVEELQGFCKGVDLPEVTSIHHHANTWGLSSNNWLADECFPKMDKLTNIDFSNTVKYAHRSDLCMGIKSMLLSVQNKSIQVIDLSENFLDVDGARSFSEFI